MASEYGADAKWVRNELKKKYPDVKFSVRQRDYGVLNIDVMQSKGKYDFRKYLKIVKEGSGLKTPSQMKADDYEFSYLGVPREYVKYNRKTKKQQKVEYRDGGNQQYILGGRDYPLKKGRDGSSDMSQPHAKIDEKDIDFWNGVLRIARQVDHPTKREWYDKSDSMSDYTDIAYYLRIGIGGGGKSKDFNEPYKYTDSKGNLVRGIGKFKVVSTKKPAKKRKTTSTKKPTKRQSPDSKGFVKIGTVRKGNDGNEWVRVERKGTKGVWKRKTSPKGYYMKSGIKIYGERPKVDSQAEQKKARSEGKIKVDKDGREYYMMASGIKAYVNKKENKPVMEAGPIRSKLF